MAARLPFCVLTALVLCPFALTAQPPAVVLEQGGIQFPDGSVLSSAHRAYRQVVVVAQEGGQYTSISAAVTSISGGGDPPGVDNVFLVWVGPGVYEEQVTMVPWVDIRGAGERLVKIRYADAPAVIAGNDSELASITVESSSSAGASVAVSAIGLERFEIREATLSAKGGATARGLHSDGSKLYLKDVTIQAEEATDTCGVFIENNSLLEIRSGAITAITHGPSARGVRNTNSSLRVWNAQIAAHSQGEAYGIDGTVGGHSHLRFSSVRGIGFSDVPATSPVGYGVHLVDNAGLTLEASSVVALGATGTHALRGEDNASLSLLHSDIAVLETTEHFAIQILNNTRALVLYTSLWGLIGPFGAVPDYNCHGAVKRDWPPTGPYFTPLDDRCQVIATP